MSEPRPIVSCIIPTYESPELATRAIMSALEQQDVSIEVLVSDDSKSDRIRNFVEALQPNYPCLRYIEGARTGNPVANWNRGLREAGGTYCVLLHHDEFFLDSHYLAAASGELEKSGARATLAVSQVLGGISRPSRFGLARRLFNSPKTPLWTIWLSNWIGSTACVVWRRADAPTFDERLVGIVDIDFYTRLLQNAGPVIRLPGLALASMAHEEQISNRVNLKATVHREIDEKRREQAYGFSRAKWSLIARYWNFRSDNG